MKNVKVTTVLVIETTWTEEDFTKEVPTGTFDEDGNAQYMVIEDETEFEAYVDKLRSLDHDELTEVVSDCWDNLSVFEYNKIIAHTVQTGLE
jgi:hypothetical protein